MARNSKLSTLIILIVLVLLGAGGYFMFQDMSGPSITLSHTQTIVSPTLQITATLSDEKSAIKSVQIVVRHNEQVIPVAEQFFASPASTQEVTFSLENTGLKNATVDLEITATDASYAMFGRGNTTTEIRPLTIDSTPPRVSVKTTVPNVRRGGTGVIVYSVSKEISKTGVQVDELFFPAFRQSNGDYVCFFAFPYNIEDIMTYNPELVAIDLAGNSRISKLGINRMPRQFKKDTLNIGQGFLDSKAVEFEQIVPGHMSDVERFVKVNSDVRRANALYLLEIGKETANEMLWKGSFKQLPRSATRSGFADHRTYMWEGQQIDEQTHLGFDLASTRQAPIPAANSGVVVFAGYLGIYGNLVVIDHGFGMQSLYSHMSEIAVQKGDVIGKNQTIGKTGATGMAGGDHLHFGVLIGGFEVTPLEWLDDHWIKDNVIDRLIEAGSTIPSSSPQ